MVSGTVGENSALLGLHGKSRIAARVFLMTGLRDIHFEQRSVTFFFQAVLDFVQILDPAEGTAPPPNTQFPLAEPFHAFPTFPLPRDVVLM